MAIRGDRIGPLLDTWEPRIRNAFLSAVRDLRGRVDQRRLVKLLKAGDVEGALELIGIDPTDFRLLEQVIEQTYEAGGRDAVLAIRPSTGAFGVVIRPTFDMNQPSAGPAIRSHAVELIRQITEDQRAMVRAALAPIRSGLDPMLTGDTPQKLALDLVGRINPATGARSGGLIGLTSQHATWAANYASELERLDPGALKRALRDKRYDRTIAKAIRDGVPIPADKRQAMVEQYRNRALRSRAETIAEAEAGEALHGAQREAWDQAVRRGVVQMTKVRRFWIDMDDAKVRRTHRAIPGMNPGGVGLHEPFQTPKGPTMNPGWQFDPGCRCRVRIRVVD